jgi:hypothetical protein
MDSALQKRLQQTPATNQRLNKDEFTLTDGTANQRTLVAEYQVPSPTVLRADAPIRFAVTTVEEFQTDGTASNTETFSLSNDVIETPNTVGLVLYKGGTRVQPDSIDYSADTFDFTDSGTGNYLHAHYVARDPTQIQIERQAPKSQGSISDVVFDDPTSLLHVRDQNEDPPTFDGRDALDFTVPRNWKLQIYADGPYPVEWDDSAESNSQSTTATNALVSLPVRRADSDVEGLSRATKRHIIEK